MEPQLFLERERAAILAEAKTDDLISEAPKPALDQSGEWQETSGEIQWVASETNDNQPEKKEEEEEELDLNKGRFTQLPIYIMVFIAPEWWSGVTDGADLSGVL